MTWVFGKGVPSSHSIWNVELFSILTTAGWKSSIAPPENLLFHKHRRLMSWPYVFLFDSLISWWRIFISIVKNGNIQELLIYSASWCQMTQRELCQDPSLSSHYFTSCWFSARLFIFLLKIKWVKILLGLFLVYFLVYLQCLSKSHDFHSHQCDANFLICNSDPDCSICNEF